MRSGVKLIERELDYIFALAVAPVKLVRPRYVQQPYKQADVASGPYHGFNKANQSSAGVDDLCGRRRRRHLCHAEKAGRNARRSSTISAISPAAW
jgi:hypothetical protein